MLLLDLMDAGHACGAHPYSGRACVAHTYNAGKASMTYNNDK